MFASEGTSAEAGLAFERALYADLLEAADWPSHSGPDALDMGGALQSRTGIHYEFDGIFLTSDTLYIVEAKRHAHITRLHLSEFVIKLLDVTLGSADQLGGLAIKPVFVSGLPHIDANAWSYAVSWGVLLITAARPNPWELLTMLEGNASPIAPAAQAMSDCKALCKQLWRPLNSIITPVDAHHERFYLEAPAIYHSQRVNDILEFWDDCRRTVMALTSTGSPANSRQAQPPRL